MKEQKKEQEVQWSEAQKIPISVDLIPEVKQQLKFLATIDRIQCLYDGSVLDRAISRYQKCWLPLLAKQAEFDVLEGPLVVPLDCEWIWHCHRLNPKRYKVDCEQCFGKMLDNFNVVSTILGTCSKQTEKIWIRMYPDEPFELDLHKPCLKSDGNDKLADAPSSTDYDLVSAVKRQSTFFYQVSRPFMSNDIFLQEAVARYKGFLHLIKKNKERCTIKFCVPTYDIDLVWHAHQLHPALYCEDTTAICGNVLGHDDTDTDRAEGKRLSVGFTETIKQWEEVYGLRYGRAGTMYRGNAPLPIVIDACLLEEVPGNIVFDNMGDGMVLLPKKALIEVMLEIVEVKSIPNEHKDDMFVLFSKQHKNHHHETKKKLNISSDARKKQIAIFQCEPSGELILELMSNTKSTQTRASSKVSLGSITISMKKIVNPKQGLSIDSWFELSSPSEITNSRPRSMRIALSFTPPFRAPYVLNMISSKGCPKSHIYVLDEVCNQVIELYMRQKKIGEKEVIGIVGSREPQVLANNVSKGWSLLGTSWDLFPRNKPHKLGNVYELTGQRKVVLMPGIKADYETKCNIKEDEQNFITAIEFSSQHPYGKAVALLNLKSGFLQIKEDWFLTVGIISAYILRIILISNGGFMPTDIYKNTKQQAFQYEADVIYGRDYNRGGGSYRGSCGGGGNYYYGISKENIGADCGGSCDGGGDCYYHEVSKDDNRVSHGGSCVNSNCLGSYCYGICKDESACC